MTQRFAYTVRLIVGPVAIFAIASCSGTGAGERNLGDDGPVEWETGGRPVGEEDPWGRAASADGAAYAAADAGMAPPEGEYPPGAEEPKTGNGQVPTGVLTAGSLDDHLNPQVFDAFLEHAATFAQQGPSLAQRAQIRVVDAAGAPLNDARVQVRSASSNTLLLDARTGSDGRTLFVPAMDNLAAGETDIVVQVTAGSVSAKQAFELVDGDQLWTLTLNGATAALPTKLDLAFVVDTTGSMGDELEFLKAEAASIAAKVAAGYPAVDIRFGLIVYRDEGDEYITRGYGFGDLAAFQSFLAKQSAAGGGDYPEAMHTALDEAAHRLPWRAGNVARVAFLLADAPPHDQHLEASFAALDELRRAGVRLYPVASSGVADLAEYVMRAGAFLTLARYVFLTDDSGIGNPHAEPYVPQQQPEAQPCYVIEKLEQLMIRMIASELAGELLAPDPASVLRTVGNPVDGVCQPEAPTTTTPTPAS